MNPALALPILDDARRFEALWVEAGELDRQRRALLQAPEANRRRLPGIERRLEANETARQALKDLIASIKATTPAEAAIQVMLAIPDIATLHRPVTAEVGEHVAGRLERLLFSALSVLVVTAGIDLAEYGGNRCTPPWCNVWPDESEDDG